MKITHYTANQKTTTCKCKLTDYGFNTEHDRCGGIMVSAGLQGGPGSSFGWGHCGVVGASSDIRYTPPREITDLIASS